MASIKEIQKACAILGIGREATLDEIKYNYKTLQKKYHPDITTLDPKLSSIKTREINEAYSTLKKYISQYKFSFDENEIEKYIDSNEWWFRRFGQDPTCGKKKN